MIDLKLDILSHDLIISNNDLVMVDGVERVRQQIAIKLKLWTGEWFLNTEFGTPYLTEILGKQISLSGAIAALKMAIMDVEGVDSITRFNYDFSRTNRSLSVSFDVSTEYGIVTYAT